MERSMPDDVAGLTIRRAAPDGYSWDTVEARRYKEDPAAAFQGVTRRVLFSDRRLSGELRYFEVSAGGYSTLERHQHMHAVLVLRGAGRCLVGGAVHAIGLHDLITVPPWTWHQFRAAPDQKLGFLCLVDAERDKPTLPSEADREALMRTPAARDFLAGG
jgi:quercetin dioxygenase-like cupin family protein